MSWLYLTVDILTSKFWCFKIVVIRVGEVCERQALGKENYNGNNRV